MLGSIQRKKKIVGPVGVEPTRCYHRRILSPLRLPIPPQPQVTPFYHYLEFGKGQFRQIFQSSFIVKICLKLDDIAHVIRHEQGAKSTQNSDYSCDDDCGYHVISPLLLIV